jgi:hypothetical protein
MRVASSRSAPFHERALAPRLDRASLSRPRPRHRRVVTWRASFGPSGGKDGDVFVPATWRDLNIDWGRRHLQVLFVDADHGVLARSAEGVCARVAMWSGAGHVVFPESAGLDVGTRTASSQAFDADGAMRLLTRLAPVCDHPRYAARAPYALTDADAAAADLVITLGGVATERAANASAPSASNVIDLLQFSSFAQRAEIDGTGVAAILQRSLALEVVAPELLVNDDDDDAFSVLTSPVEAWGLADENDVLYEGAEAETAFQASLRTARARVVVGVVGLITFLLLTAPIEEVERRTKR